jgi:hypothetical protein
MVDLSMSGYIQMALCKFKHTAPHQAQKLLLNFTRVLWSIRRP